MKKKTIAKKIVKIFFIIFLVFSLLNSCSPLSSHALGLDIFDIYSFTKFVPFHELVENTIVEIANDTVYQDIGLKLVSSDALVVDINNFNSLQSGSVSVSPFYSLTGKEGGTLSDGSTFTVTCQISFSTNRNFTYPNNEISGLIPLQYSMYSELSHNKISPVGTIFYTLAITDTSGNSTTEHFCFVPDSANYMPYLSISSSASSLDVSVNWLSSSRSGTYYNLDALPYLTPVSVTCSSVLDFHVRTVNSILQYDGLSASSLTPQSIIMGSYSLGGRYTLSSVLTNDTSFISLYNERVQSNSASYGSNFEPVFKKVGIDARQTITVNNYNNYVDRGITYNSTTNQYGLNTYHYDTYFQEHDIPEIKIVYDDLFNNQPAPLQPFSDTIRYNYNDLVAIPLSSDYLPSEWLDSYGSLDTHPNINIDDFLSVPTQTFDSNLIQDMGVVTSSGMNLLDVFGLASPFLALALLGVLFKFFD